MSKSVYLKCSDILDTWWWADLKLLHLSGLASSCEKMFVLNTFLVCLNLHLSKSAEYAPACYYANPDFWVDSFTRKVPTLLKGRGRCGGLQLNHLAICPDPSVEWRQNTTGTWIGFRNANILPLVQKIERHACRCIFLPQGPNLNWSDLECGLSAAWMPWYINSALCSAFTYEHCSTTQQRLMQYGCTAVSLM